MKARRTISRRISQRAVQTIRGLFGACALLVCFGTAAPVMAESASEAVEKHESLYASERRRAQFEIQRRAPEPMLAHFCPRVSEIPAARLIDSRDDADQGTTAAPLRVPLRC